MATDPQGYFDTRLAYDQKRGVLWWTLVQAVFGPMIDPSDTVVELGAGWCDFINSVAARRRVAVDVWGGIMSDREPRTLWRPPEMGSSEEDANERSISHSGVCPGS